MVKKPLSNNNPPKIPIHHLLRCICLIYRSSLFFIRVEVIEFVIEGEISDIDSSWLGGLPEICGKTMEFQDTSTYKIWANNSEGYITQYNH